jgi:hypothetical protein
MLLFKYKVNYTRDNKMETKLLTIQHLKDRWATRILTPEGALKSLEILDMHKSQLTTSDFYELKKLIFETVQYPTKDLH